MQQLLTNHNPDLLKLHQEGYDIDVIGGHLVVRQIPYVTPAQQVKYGTLVCVLTYSTPTKISSPPDHTIYFIGETPCNGQGQHLSAIINNSNSQQLTSELTVQHYFSSRPITGNYQNYYDKVRTYAEILSIHAKELDKTVTTRPNKRS